MSRYIDADVFEVFGYTSQDGTFDDGVQFVLEKIDEQPTADVVEVGRCGECRFTDGLGAIADGRHWCVLHGSFMYYCSDFERELEDEQIR